MNNKTLTLLMMDSSFEQTRTITAFRIIEEALERGHNVNVFAYEGAVNLAFAKQNNYDRAIENYNQALKLNPQDAVAYFYRGLAQIDQQAPAAAGACLNCSSITLPGSVLAATIPGNSGYVHPQPHKTG